MINKKDQQIKDVLNGFEKHGLKHVSPSSMNKAQQALDAWIADKLFKFRFPTGWPAVQGSGVEHGVNFGVYNDADPDDCVRMAVDYVRKNALLLPNSYDELEKRKPIIEQMVRTTLEQLKPLGKPAEPPRGSHQWKIEIPVRFKEGKNGTVPAIGYLDFWYPDHNLVLDLKTTAKAPSSWSLAHGIQAAVYSKAKERELGEAPTVKFFYALTRKKDPFVWLELEDPSFYLAHFKRTVKNLEALLTAHTREELLSMIPHNPDSFYWSDAESIKSELYPA